jgi:pilus assembly protein Flp/PilA
MRNALKGYWSVRTVLRLLKNDGGQDLIEYALLGALIAVVSVLTMTTLGTSISGLFTTISGAL